MLYEFNVRLPSDEIIQCKTFPLKPYSEILITKSKGESIVPLLKDLLNQYANAGHLPKHDAEFVLIHLLNNSLNEDVTPRVIKQCLACEHKEEVALDLKHLSIYKSKELSDVDFGKFKIRLRYPKIFDDSNTALLITSCIDAIVVGDEVIGVDDLTDVELNDLYEAITVDHLREIKDMLLSPEIQLAIPYKCPSCGKEEVFVISGLSNLLDLIL